MSNTNDRVQMTVSEAADYVGVTRKTVHNRIEKGELSCNWVGKSRLVYQDDVERVFADTLMNTQIATMNTPEATRTLLKLLMETHSTVQGMSKKIDELETEISELRADISDRYESKDTNTTKNAISKPGKPHHVSIYDKRKQEAIEKGKAAYRALQSELGRTPNKVEVTNKSGLARGTVAKYWDEFQTNDGEAKPDGWGDFA